MTQLRATRRLAAGNWRDEAFCAITLNKDQRHRRRIVLKADTGLEFLLDLPDAVQLCHGDGLQLEDGRVIRVLAEAEELLQVRARDSLHLLQLAWHLGNRHLEAQIEDTRILVRRDHVIESMLVGLGASTTAVLEPFTPQSGAYHSHSHTGHDHDH